MFWQAIVEGSTSKDDFSSKRLRCYAPSMKLCLFLVFVPFHSVEDFQVHRVQLLSTSWGPWMHLCWFPVGLVRSAVLWLFSVLLKHDDVSGGDIVRNGNGSADKMPNFTFTSSSTTSKTNSLVYLFFLSSFPIAKQNNNSHNYPFENTFKS